MTQTRPNGIKVPTNSDEYMLTDDLAKMADSISVLMTASSKAARDALPKMLGMQVMRTDRDNFVQIWDGTRWAWVTRPARYTATTFSTLSNASSRAVATINPPTRSYATRVSVYGQLTVASGPISAGVKAINVAVSAALGVVTAAQGKAQMAWNASTAGLNQSVAPSRTDILVAASVDPVCRLWIEDLGGSVVTNPSASAFASFYADILPEDD